MIRKTAEVKGKIAELQKQASNIGFCPIANCAIHVTNNARINAKRSLSHSEDELHLDNDAADLNSFKFPSKRLTSKVKANDATVRQEYFVDSNNVHSMSINFVDSNNVLDWFLLELHSG
ncbi:hypothetical protein AVEN_196584-1 [Araneus ventricosus]|uniref:Uncharacterized protein n=1 Tax=Araneus ventricosus TaxID=182803 RepID=A0A4Y2WNF3_ARAVE|nr:hypothetical protein AVEN_196584-1 [Araneus ventricosus]